MNFEAETVKPLDSVIMRAISILEVNIDVDWKRGGIDTCQGSNSAWLYDRLCDVGQYVC